MHTTKPRTLRSTDLRLARCVLVLLVAAARFAGAQPTSPPPASSEPPSDEVITLSEFTVSGTADSGYRATNSISGTKMDTPIKQIPMNIQVFTRDFFDDLAAPTMTDLVSYNAALTNPNGDRHSDLGIKFSFNNFLFRGFTQNWTQRDGVRAYDPADTQGLARVEVVKGPAAVLYGVTYPGGVINVITKEPDPNADFARFRLQFGSEGGYRATADINTAGSSKAGRYALRVNAAEGHDVDEREHSEGREKLKSANFSWYPTAQTTVNLLWEQAYRAKPNGLGYFSRGELDASTPDPIDTLNNGADIPLQIIHPEIPWDWNWGHNDNVYTAETDMFRATITQSFGDKLDLRGYFEIIDRKNQDSDGYDAQGSGGQDSWEAASGTGWRWDLPLTGGGPEVIRTAYNERTWNNDMYSYGFTGIYRFDFNLGDAKVENKFLFGSTVWWEDFLTSSHRVNAANTLDSSVNYLEFPVQADIDIPASPVPNQIVVNDTTGTKNYKPERNTYDTYYLNWQGSFFDKRLQTNLGVTYTNVKTVSYPNYWGTSQGFIMTDHRTSPMVGAVYNFTDEFNIYGLYSESLFPDTSLFDGFGQPFPALVGKGKEVGTKVDLFNGKVSGTLSFYEITQSRPTFDPTAPNARSQAFLDSGGASEPPGTQLEDLLGANVPNGEQLSRGIDVDLIFQPTPALQIVTSYATNNAHVSKDDNPANLGLKPNNHIKNQWSVLAKYTVMDGPAKGLNLGLGARYSSKRLIEYRPFNDENIPRYEPSRTIAELFVGYPFNVLGYRASVQLNVKNLTEEDDYYGWMPTGSADILSLDRFAVPTKRRYYLTFGLDF